VVHFTFKLLSHAGIAAAASLALGVAAEGQEQDAEQLQNEERRRQSLVLLAGLLAAAIHDYQHDGLNNSFLVNTSNPKAIRYNDKSPNENHHVASAFEVLLKPEYNFLDKLPIKEYHAVRTLIIEMVLGTDMAESGRLVKAFGDANITSDGCFVPTCRKDAILSLQIALKCADVGHLALGWTSHMRWVQRLEQEFFKQGDREKKIGVPDISFLMDSEKPGVSENQVGFFNFVALPLYRALVNGFAKSAPMLEAVEANSRKWSDIQDDAQSC